MFEDLTISMYLRNIHLQTGDLSTLHRQYFQAVAMTAPEAMKQKVEPGKPTDIIISFNQK